MTRRRTTPSGADSWPRVTAQLRESAHLREELPTERQRVQPLALEFAGRVQGRRVLDVGPPSSALVAKLREAGADVVVCTDLLDPGSPLRGPFDLITAAHYLDDCADPEAALRSAGKLLHPRGRIVIVIVHPWRGVAGGAVAHPALASLPSLLASLRGAGLRLTDAAEPEPIAVAGKDSPGPRHLLLVAERTGRRTRNRGTSG